jgi:polyhydroxyalkanoate synthase
MTGRHARKGEGFGGKDMKADLWNWWIGGQDLPGVVFAQLDRSRRGLGEWLDLLGYGPQETPSRVAFHEPGVTLRSYGNLQADGPVLLVVPAPIKRGYIWDLVPSLSVVRRCLQGGLRVYLVHWERPGEPEQGFGLAEYADRLILDCLRAIAVEGRESRVFLAGHSLGGTLAALFSALHPDQVRGLVLLGAPLHFGRDAGLLGAAVAAAPRARALTAVLGNVPGSFLSTVSFAADPATFGWWRWLDWLGSLPDPRALQSHLRVERWALDEMPLARQLFEELCEHLFREDRFVRGTLQVGGRRVAPELVTAPLLSVVDPRCNLAPPRAVLPFHDAVSSTDTRLLEYHGDTGVALRHVCMLMGREAHERLWPEVIGWVRGHWKVA